ncbi:hypothetical protein BABINDRAFT_160914 [Babjeviella inositovora NRRL Y-12698]|uniref:SH3 domain-containing protein n=1 Tax=Babjeviella inositovora NRRL Y-12698 TaxID=984486 RepID=A0A1E3QUP9_9ASCO|nr:uncharacterized protein BABINDRAFT_160914 [Babjeviella inositovora NRRL Y-12698]ODQ80677.1 hypothetical protein BABINDRAFT_160914 [Babjeviella inositovora NRRL Y-12698]
MKQSQVPPLPFRVKTTHSWPGEVSGDLGFVEGDIIEVLSFVDDEWWMGKLKRNQLLGIFPSDFVTIVEDKLNQSMRVDMRASTAPRPKDQSMRQTDKLLKSPKSPSPVPEQPDGYYEDEEVVDPYGFSFRSSKNKFDYQQLTKEEYLQLQNLQLQQQQIQLQQQLLRQQRMPKSASVQALDRVRRAGMPTSQSDNNLTRSPSPQKQGFMSYDGYYMEPSPKNGGERNRQSPRGQPKSHDSGPPGWNHTGAQESRYTSRPRDGSSQSRLPENGFNGSTPQSHTRSNHARDIRSYPPTDESLSSRYDVHSTVSGKAHSNHSKSNDISTPSSFAASTMYHATLETDESDFSDAPPLPPKHAVPRYKSSNNITGMLEPPRDSFIPYDADDLRMSLLKAKMANDEVHDEKLMRVLQDSEKAPGAVSMTTSHLGYSTQSQDSEISIRSDFSATSAGSFAQHKFRRVIDEKKQMIEEGQSAGATLQQQKEIIDSIFEIDKKSRHPNFLKKIFAKEKGAAPALPLEHRLTQLKLTEDTFQAELNRMNTLKLKDKQDRSKRVNEEENVILKPFDFINEINKNEVDELRMEEPPYLFWQNKQNPYNSFDVTKRFLASFHAPDLRTFLQEVDAHFQNHTLEKIKTVFYKLVEFSLLEEVSEKISVARPLQKLDALFAAHRGTLYELNYLFKKMLDGLRIESEVVLGYMKKPEALNDTLIINHCWVSVLVNGEYRMIDYLLFKNHAMMNRTSYNDFYFLTKPLDLIHTHIPSMIDSQHIVPPVDLLISLSLPYCYSGYHRYALHLLNFNNGLTKLKDHEFFEIDVQLPYDVEVFTHIKTADGTEHNDLTLCQILWRRDKRIARIKALLPPKTASGFLQVFAGPKGVQKTLNNVHELAVVIPLHHKGEYKAIEFVSRYPTNQSKANDLYIKQPQINNVLNRNTYTFQIFQHPSKLLMADSPYLGCKLGLQTPSGKLIPLKKEANGKPYGMYELSIRINEVGTYRGLVMTDSGNSWCVFAAWECVTNDA